VILLGVAVLRNDANERKALGLWLPETATASPDRTFPVRPASFVVCSSSLGLPARGSLTLSWWLRRAAVMVPRSGSCSSAIGHASSRPRFASAATARMRRMPSRGRVLRQCAISGLYVIPNRSVRGSRPSCVGRACSTGAMTRTTKSPPSLASRSGLYAAACRKRRLASAGLMDDEVRARARARELFWCDAFQDVFRRGESDRFVSHFATDLVIGWSDGKMARGRDHDRSLHGASSREAGGSRGQRA